MVFPEDNSRFAPQAKCTDGQRNNRRERRETDSPTGRQTEVGNYRVVLLNLTPDIEVFFMLFERRLSIFSMASCRSNSIFNTSMSGVQFSWTSL